MIHTVIVPGVGGSEHAHWQSWLQRQLLSCSRVQQQDWNLPILDQWVEKFVAHVSAFEQPLQIIAHSFGCLTTLAALDRYPHLHQQIQNLVLVAPANPIRFGEAGFARMSKQNYWNYFQNITLRLPTTLLISENDPWLKYEDALTLAQYWQLKPINLGRVGHINVASGFGPFPAIHDYLISGTVDDHINITDDGKYLFKFAI